MNLAGLTEGSSSAWPTSFFVAAGSDSSSDSMSFSDDEDRKAASSPTFVSRLKDQAQDLTTQLPSVARSRAAALDRSMNEFGSVASDLMASVISQAEQLPDVARSRSAALDRNMSGVRSAASDFVTSVMSKAAEIPGQRFGISSFSPSSSPQRARSSSKLGQTGNSYGTSDSGGACLHGACATFKALCCNCTFELCFVWHGCMQKQLA